MIKANKYVFTEILERSWKHRTCDSGYSKRNNSLMNVCKPEQCRCKADRICSNLLLVHLQYWQITKMPFEKKTLLPSFVLCWVSLLMLCPHCHSQLTHQSNQLTKNEVLQHTSTLLTHTHIKRVLLPKLLFRVKAISQGSDCFLTAVPNMLHKTNSFLADVAVSENTILSALHKCFVQPNCIQWFIWVLLRCNNLLRLYVAQHDRVQISLTPWSPATTGY